MGSKTAVAKGVVKQGLKMNLFSAFLYKALFYILMVVLGFFGACVGVCSAAQAVEDIIWAMLGEEKAYYVGYPLKELSVEVCAFEPKLQAKMEELEFTDAGVMEIALGIIASVTDNGETNLDNPMGVVFPEGVEHNADNSISLGVERMFEVFDKQGYPVLSQVWTFDTDCEPARLAFIFYFIQGYELGTDYYDWLLESNIYDDYEKLTLLIKGEESKENVHLETDGTSVRTYTLEAEKMYLALTQEERPTKASDHWGKLGLTEAVRLYYDPFKGYVVRHGEEEYIPFDPTVPQFDANTFEKDYIRQTVGVASNIDNRALPNGYWETFPGVGSRYLSFPVQCNVLSSPFGPRIHPITGLDSNHSGVDFPLAYGTPVYAARDGYIKYAHCASYEDPYTPIEEQGHPDGRTGSPYALPDDGGWGGSLGRYIIISHGDYNGAELTTIYGHLSYFRTGIGAGMYVKKGELIGFVGNTGSSTGYHLHFSVDLDGIDYDPESFL